MEKIDNKTLSIVIPVFNAAEFLEQCIKSLINQTYQDLELIFVNDGSSDNSLKILESYARLDSRIRILNQKNQGPSVARNNGIRNCSGKFVAFVDADDFVDSNMYSEMIKCFTNNVKAVICNTIIFKDNKVEYIKKINEDGQLKANKILEILISTDRENSMNNKVYDLEVIKKFNLELNKNMHYGEDLLFNLSFFNKIDEVFYLNKDFYYYRKGHESLTNRNIENMFEENVIKLYKIRKKYAHNNNFSVYLCNDWFLENTIYSIINECRLNNKQNHKFRKAYSIINYSDVQECASKRKQQFTISGLFCYFIKRRIIIPFIIYAFLVDLKNLIRRIFI